MCPLLSVLRTRKKLLASVTNEEFLLFDFHDSWPFTPPTHFCHVLLEAWAGLMVYKESVVPSFYSSKAKGDSLCAGLSGWLERGCCSGCVHLPGHRSLPGFVPDAFLLLSRRPLRSHVNSALVSTYSSPSAVREGAEALFPFQSHFGSRICLCSVLVLPSSGTDLDLANGASLWSHEVELVSQLAWDGWRFMPVLPALV